MKHKDFVEWDSLTAKFAGFANLPFLLLQLPQIVLNYRNLLAGNRSALLAVPWLVREFSPTCYSFFELCLVECYLNKCCGYHL